MKTLRFYKDETDTWYVDLPEWTGSQAELMMVAGADTMLDILSDNGTEVSLHTSLSPFPGATEVILVRTGEEEGGGHYIIENFEGRKIDHPLWLCDVTNFVYGFIPAQIYIKKAA